MGILDIIRNGERGRRDLFGDAPAAEHIVKAGSGRCAHDMQRTGRLTSNKHYIIEEYECKWCGRTAEYPILIKGVRGS